MLEQVDVYFARTDFSSLLSHPAVKLHGWLFGSLPADTADRLHHLRLNPFSLYALDGEDSFLVRFSVVDKIADPVLDSVKSAEEIMLYGADAPLRVLRRTEHPKIALDEAAEHILRHSRGGVDVSFLTPSAHRDGKVVVGFPEFPRLFQSVVNKMNIFGALGMHEQAACALFHHQGIQHFSMDSCTFRIGADLLPAFTGRVIFRLPKNREDRMTMARILAYATYSGVGAKTGMGMGGCVVNL